MKQSSKAYVPMKNHEYSAEFYRKTISGVQRSAELVVPLVMKLIGPKSVVDVGCGVGTWLKVFKGAGVADVLGLDGSYVQVEMLEIPESTFSPVDLTQRIDLGRQFDLVVSLEVAEHLDETHADNFVDTLVSLGPVVLFSAAIPSQGGEHHVNEQWPTYWVDHFARRGYVVVDCLRKQIWDNPEVCWWYAQNMLFFVREENLDKFPLLKDEREKGSSIALSVVHPRKYAESLDHARRDYAKLELRQVIPVGTNWLLVDDGELGGEGWGDYHVRPFLEKNGKYWGAPADSLEAEEELNARMGEGVSYIVFAWPAFWWFARYKRFHEHLEESYHCVLANERLVIYSMDRSQGDLLERDS